MTDERPRHTPEEEREFDQTVQTMVDYATLATSSAEGALEESANARAEGDHAGARNARDEANRLWRWAFAVLLAVVMLVGAFYFFSGNDEAESVSDDPSATPASTVEPDEPLSEPAVTEAEPSEDAQAVEPTHFVGTVVSDNGWFTIIVAEDGSVAGTVDLEMPVEGGTAKQNGSFSGSIGDDDIITCDGTFEGVSTDEAGHEFPHSGTMTVRAEPTSPDRSTWEITADGEPGDEVVLPAHSS